MTDIIEDILNQYINGNKKDAFRLFKESSFDGLELKRALLDITDAETALGIIAFFLYSSN